MIRNFLLIGLVLAAGAAGAQDAGLPSAELIPTFTIAFPADTDSNSPAYWDGERLYVFNSLHTPYLSEGRNVARLMGPIGVVFRGGVAGPRWMESVIQAENGTLYGYYHHEPVGVCGNTTKTAPAIGAARSTDGGLAWDDLGIIIDASPRSRRCNTDNLYFVGGEGDFSAVLDRASEYVYFLFSSYAGDVDGQGVAAARMPWAARDHPSGAVVKWRAGGWSAPGLEGRAAPFFPAAASWHAFQADAFWGPSVHWNTYLQKYVMLLTRTANASWDNEGIYVSYADALDDPLSWSAPQKILSGGAWYPQVMGLERGRGTDSVSGQLARFFMGGRSSHYIRFERPASAAQR